MEALKPLEKARAIMMILLDTGLFVRAVPAAYQPEA
ncbi:MAG: hypothetical protein QOF22_748 [Bradyrhizobium sp.]|jgi:hypothetical protein|nr:hypothetical protein [Bradyrhizobium sp.]